MPNYDFVIPELQESADRAAYIARCQRADGGPNAEYWDVRQAGYLEAINVLLASKDERITVTHIGDDPNVADTPGDNSSSAATTAVTDAAVTSTSSARAAYESAKRLLADTRDAFSVETESRATPVACASDHSCHYQREVEVDEDTFISKHLVDEPS